ncbi:MAG: 5-methyltetrahydrofolate--homocysteine methyltransferase [Flavobacteriales bacterium]|nr:5-methyltetrahydrofolate--homocysteine methyltransferase [Flavobacteriales bacterium]|tara:strand:+ start:7898 stop:8890 length:993 start_codon:yes stop_codon:yes gene_type:complete
MSIRKALQEKILVLDGAMGTMIQDYKFEENDYRGERFKEYSYPLKGNNDLLVLTQPKAIEDIHLAYLEAGADILETNTFNSNSISMEDYHMCDLVEELNLAAVECAQRAIDRYRKNGGTEPKFIAGSVGPTNKTASLSPDVNDPGYRAVTFDDLKVTYYEQCVSLIKAGVDIVLIETVFDTLNAKAALFAAQDAIENLEAEVEIMLSGTITDASGRTLSGQTTEAFLISVSHSPLLSVGLNCALGAKQLMPYLQTLDAKSPFAVSAHPNAGLPNAFGEYDETPEQMASQIKDYLELNLVNIIGGCCGTSPAHIKAIADLSKNYEPRNYDC